jgi:riboflavin kinase/FMN adenylyltransferase
MEKNKDLGVYAIGNFDGVHLGHQEIIKQTENLALQLNIKKWGVINFNPHPSLYFNQKNSGYLITPEPFKTNMLKSLGVQEVISLNFSEISQLSYEDFFHNILINKLNVKGLITGRNFCFGRARQGNVATLTKLCQENNIVYKAIADYKVDGSVCSSSKIRECLGEGDVAGANKMLGYNFNIVAKVIHGNELARTFGFPTANMSIGEYVHLKFGVYAVLVEIDGVKHQAIANFGVRPSVHNNKVELLEVHVLDYSGNLYDKLLKVYFLDFIRAEKKFASLDELKNQISLDVSSVRQYFIA